MITGKTGTVQNQEGYRGMDKVSFFLKDSEKSVDFFVLEQTRVGGVNYILVTDTEKGDAEALILKDLSGSESEESLYEVVSEDTELTAIAKVFEEILEDVEFEREKE